MTIGWPSDRDGRSENLAAHNLYLQGRYHLNQRTEEGLRSALDFFERALVEDAQYALAHSRPGRRVRPAGPLRRVRAGRGLVEGRFQRRHRGDAGRRLRGSAHVARARASPRRTGTGPGAERAFQRAISLDPRYADRASLVRDVVPGAAGTARRSARRDAGSRSRSIRCRQSWRATSR